MGYDTKTDRIDEVGKHVFERAGLGKAPFRCTGMGESTYQACPGAPIQPGSSCDYCGTGIRYVFGVLSADGKSFGVGSECIHKTHDRGLIQQFKNLPEYRNLQRMKRAARDERVKEEWSVLINCAATATKLDGVTYQQWNGESVPLIDYFKRVWNMCGAAGRARYLKALKQRLAE